MKKQSNNVTKIKISAKIDRKEKEELDELAYQDGSNFSTMIRRAVKLLLKSNK